MPSVERMRIWLDKLGHTDEAINRLNVVHVAGTKGKGSTCAFVESFLRAHGQRTGFPRKTGLYTSPHLTDYTERIRINFTPLAEPVFARYFFEVYDGLHLQPDGAQPRQMQLLALVSYHAFLSENVDVAIYETHRGGEYCATNVVQHPVVTAITRIGMDHVLDLGPTIENIAWHKAGIVKAGVPALAQPQNEQVARILQQRAADKGVALSFVDADKDVFPDALQEEQVLNASLARAVSDAFLAGMRCSPPRLADEDVQAGVRQFSWPGRFHTVSSGKYLWCLDGAHNDISMEKAAAWFQRLQPQTTPTRKLTRILVFASKSTYRDSVSTLRQLATSLHVEVDHAIFTKYADDENVTDQALLDEFGRCWTSSAVFPAKTRVWTDMATHEDVIRRVVERGEDADSVFILVTGSLHLVGSILRHVTQP